MAAIARTIPDQEVAQTVARLVESGRILIPEFTRAYDDCRRPASRALASLALIVEPRTETALVSAAVLQALQDRFFVELWTTLLDRLATVLARDPDVKRITKAIGGGSVGRMHRVLDARGFRLVRTFPALMRAARATALVLVDEQSAGSGFLVSPDLLLTAAHVVEPLVQLNGTASPNSSLRLKVRFDNQLESPGSWPIKSPVAENWLAAWSPPNGAPPALASADDETAAGRLDFALIRLAEPWGNDIGYLDIKEPPAPRQDSRLTLIGYPGGDECVSDDQRILQVDVPACRLRHDVNSTAGMSGGPCIDWRGKPLALHEGAVTAAAAPYNRAIHLGAIRKAMLNRSPDPLEASAGLLWGIQDAAARRAWISAGESLIGKTQPERLEWLSRAAAFNLATPEAAASGDTFHPVFGRKPFQDWIDSAFPAASHKRIIFVSGPPGSGRSFSAAILRAKVKAAGHLTVVLSPGAAPVADALAELYAAVATAPAVNLSPAAITTRPQAGVLRRDVLPHAFEGLRNLIAARASVAPRLWLVIDFEGDALLTSDLESQWSQLLTEAVKHEWLRIVMAGLGEGRVNRMAAVLDPERVSKDPLQEVTVDDFLATGKDMLRAIAPGDDPTAWSDKARTLWDAAVTDLSSRDGRMVEAVLIALQLRTSMRERSTRG